MTSPWRAYVLAAATAVAAIAVAAGGAAAAAPDAPADVYAIVIGYNGGRAGLPTLRFADDDAVRFTLLLRGLDAGGRPARLWLLTELDAETETGLARAGLTARPDAPPTRAALSAALAEVASALARRPPGAPDPLLYVIYAGHGLQGRILLKPDGAPEAAITGHELRAAVAELARAAPNLRTFLFLDACRSQSLFTERGADSDLGPDLTAQASELERRADEVRIGVLTAAASGKPAGEVGDLGAGYFSHVLASGLAGAADADGDEVVSFGELVAFVAFNTERLTGQRPWFAPPGGDLRVPAIDLRGRRARLDLSGAPAGRYLIAAGTGRPIFAEAYNSGRAPLRLALPAGRYRILRGAAAGPAQQADVDLRPGERLDLGRAAWADGTAAASRARGGDEGSPTFESAFTPEVVSTLVAGFDAGRSPVRPREPPPQTLGLAFAVAAAPLGLPGAELGLSLRYRLRLGAWFAGARAELARSSHDQPGSYTLDRYAGWLEAGPRWAVRAGLELTLFAAAGGGPVVRRASDGPTAGDPFAPAIAAGVGADVQLHAAWRAFVDLRYAAQWVLVDGARRAWGAAAAAAGVAVAF
ncbi:MAG: hypothetical protein ACJ8F1_06330 [Polyangia bacterium]